ncbi:MAG: hypothetical protein PHG82_03555 [Candidatus Gracilibacteria bacterium]|nr:hypothetical protein [Candidatus Gracilibacteria bacterium]
MKNKNVETYCNTSLRNTKNKSAFTLVELLVSISLAIVLMVSISMFVTDGVKNITLQKNIVDTNSDFNDFKSIFSNTLSSANKYLTGFTNSTGALFKLDKSYSVGGFAYIGEQSFTGTYCSGTDNDSTNHLIIKNFVPFESINTDLFSGYNYDDGTYKTSFFSGIISKSGIAFTGTYFGPTDLIINGTDMYVSDTLNNTVLKFDKTNTNIAPVIVAGKPGNFGSDLNSLNNPTGLAFGDNILFIADTLNNRILYVSGGIVSELLNREDGIREPTGLYYDSASKTLYIANSGAGEILSYSSKSSISNPNLNINLNINQNITGITDLLLKFYSGNNLASPINITGTPSFSFTNISNTAGTVSTGITLKYTFGTANTFNPGTSYQVNINSLPTSFASTGNYFVNMTLSGTSTWTENFPYFTQSDNNILTKSDNILKVITGGLSYPTGIKFDGTNIIFSDFLERKIKTIDLNGNYISDSPLQVFDFSHIAYNKYSDYMLNTPIKSLDLGFFSSNIFSFNLEYYKNYSCNNSKDNISRTYLFKKYLK